MMVPLSFPTALALAGLFGFLKRLVLRWKTAGAAGRHGVVLPVREKPAPRKEQPFSRNNPAFENEELCNRVKAVPS